MMLKRYAVCLFLCLSLIDSGQGFAQTLSRQQLRMRYLAAIERRTALDSFMRTLEVIDRKSPTEESYYGICHGICCQYEESNWSKLRLVMKSRSYLNEAVERDPRDPELRFMRLTLEHFLPSFLGLNKHIPDDLAVIFAHPHFVDDNPPIKKKILEFLLWTQRCTAEQNKQLQAELDQLNKKS